MFKLIISFVTYFIICNSFAAVELRLTYDPSRDFEPSWSPDGRTIAFTTDRTGTFNIWLINATGGGVRPFASCACDDYQPAWSPTGDRIAAASEYAGYAQSECICTAGLGGRSIILLTEPRSTFYDSDPSWSPDGRNITFSSFKYDRGRHIYKVPSAGGQVTRLTPTNILSGFWCPAWSPDGTRIALSYQDVNTGSYRLGIIPAQGGNVTPITSNGFDAFYPCWSPDSTKIAFQRDINDSEKSDIYIIPAVGGLMTRVTNDGFNNLNPTWSPDGRCIAFSSNRYGNEDIYVIDLSIVDVEPSTLGNIKALYK
jgi:Tol biopolymer transport system component